MLLRCSEGQQKSRHGHLSYNLEGLGHVPHRAPINVTAVTGVSGGLISSPFSSIKRQDVTMLSRQVEVQFMCRVAVHECGNFYSIVWYEVTLQCTVF